MNYTIWSLKIQETEKKTFFNFFSFSFYLLLDRVDFLVLAGSGKLGQGIGKILNSGRF